MKWNTGYGRVSVNENDFKIEIGETVRLDTVQVVETRHLRGCHTAFNVGLSIGWKLTDEW